MCYRSGRDSFVRNPAATTVSTPGLSGATAAAVGSSWTRRNNHAKSNQLRQVPPARLHMRTGDGQTQLRGKTSGHSASALRQRNQLEDRDILGRRFLLVAGRRDE